MTDEIIPTSEVTFVKMHCVTYSQDSDEWGRRRPPTDLFFVSKEAMRVCLDSIKYPLYVVRVTERVAVKFGDSYHPLGNPVSFAPAEPPLSPSDRAAAMSQSVHPVGKP